MVRLSLPVLILTSLALTSCASLFTPAIQSQTFRLEAGSPALVSVGYIDGNEVRLMWDTGSTVSICDRPPPALPPESAADQPYSQSFDQGDSHLDYAGYGVNSGFFHDAGVYGLIGGSTFAQHLVIFDFEDRVVTLTNQKLDEFASPDAFRFHFKVIKGIPWITVLLNGKPKAAILDTGNTGGLVWNVAHAPEAVDEAKYSGDGGEDAFGKVDTVPVWKIGAIDVLGVHQDGVLVAGIRGSHSADFEGRLVANEIDPNDANVGLEFLKHGVLALDYRTGEGFWKKQSEPAWQHEIVPFIVGRNGVVIGVDVRWKGNPVKVGDKIVSIDGRAPSTGPNDALPQTVDLERDGQTLTVSIPPRNADSAKGG